MALLQEKDAKKDNGNFISRNEGRKSEQQLMDPTFFNAI